MTDNTPVEMAAEALRPHQGRATARTSYGEHSTPMITLTAEDAARTALTAVADREALARVLAESMPCTWSIPQDGHPYDDGCVHRRGGQGRGACWDQAWELAAAVARWLTGEEA